MPQSRPRNHLLRNLMIGLLMLVVLYSLAGFLVLPWALKRALPAQLEQHMGWQAEVDDIRSNPFALSVEALGLSAQDSSNESVVSFDRLFINLNFFELLRGVIGFESIELEAPFIRMDLLEDYSLNLARDWQNANPEKDNKPAEPNAAPEGQALPALYFQQVSISGGELLFRDFSQPDMAEFRVTPLDITLSDLATWQRDDSSSDYNMQAAIGSQTIEWQGNLSVAPLYSSGSLVVAGVDYKTLGHFLAPYLPYDLRGGKVTVSSDYELQAGDIQYLVTRRGKLTVENLAVATDQQSEQADLSTAVLNVDDIRFDLNAREASVGQISAEQPSIALTRNNAGEIDWMAKLPARAGEAELASEASASASTGEPFRWSIDGIRVSEGTVHWLDQQPASAADLTLEQLSLTIGSVHSALGDPVTYRLKTALKSGGMLSLNGQLTPQPFNLEAAVSGSGVVLAVFEPYLQEATNLAIAGGTLGVDGNLDLDGQQAPLTGTFSGTADVSDLNLKLPGSKERLISWQTLRLAPIEYNVHPSRLEIGTVMLAQPAINLVRNTNGVHNLEQIVPSSEPAGAAPQASKTVDNEDSALIFRVGQLVIEQGAVDYTDRTLTPSFTTSMDQLNGTVTGLSNVSPQQGKVALHGRIGGDASVEFDGTIGTLGTEETSDLKLTMSDLSLPGLSPYLARYLGYGIDSGKLNLDLDYKITGSQIDASNKVVLDRLGLGKAVTSKEAINAPVKLGLALLRDSKGVIEVNLPVSGNMDSPEFSLGQVVMGTFVNLLAKAATSPFSVLGSLADLAGLSGEELGQMTFEPGTTKLAPGEAEKLAVLADALHDRPDLLLNIRGGFSPSADGVVLLHDQLAAGQNEKLTEEAWNEARKAYLAGERTLAPETLNNLASARASTVQDILRDTQGVAANQLYMLEPSNNAKVANDGNVIVEFTLDAR